MITIPVKVCGDVWCDPVTFTQALSCADPHADIMIDMRAEGASLGALGLLEVLQNHCDVTGRNPASIKLINSPNNLEHSVFENTHRGISHFFAMSIRYWEPVRLVCAQAKRFAMFVGRGTVARCVIMYELAHDPMTQHHFCFSTMSYNGRPIWQPYDEWKVIEDFHQWLSPDQIPGLQQWWLEARPPSLDGKNVVDQYNPNHNTNRSLLSSYRFFNIELVAETYTLGETFFPTEKTVRPIMAARPWLIYGPASFLKNLKELGFRSFHDLWDESYDAYQGPQRWQKIKEVIHTLSMMSDDDFRAVMDQAQHIAMFNRRILADLVLTNKAEAISSAGIT